MDTTTTHHQTGGMKMEAQAKDRINHAAMLVRAKYFSEALAVLHSLPVAIVSGLEKSFVESYDRSLTKAMGF